MQQTRSVSVEEGWFKAFGQCVCVPDYFSFIGTVRRRPFRFILTFLVFPLKVLAGIRRICSDFFLLCLVLIVVHLICLKLGAGMNAAMFSGGLFDEFWRKVESHGTLQKKSTKRIRKQQNKMKSTRSNAKYDHHCFCWNKIVCFLHFLRRKWVKLRSIFIQSFHLAAFKILLGFRWICSKSFLIWWGRFVAEAIWFIFGAGANGATFSGLIFREFWRKVESQGTLQRKSTKHTKKQQNDKKTVRMSAECDSH